VQQENQRQLLGKLLHDLRNPVHSIRISMELFGRLARRTGELDHLLYRAALYIYTSQDAVANLVPHSHQLARYLAMAPAPETETLSVDEVLGEVMTLLRAAKRRLQTTSTPPDPPTLALRADRTRLCHVLLHACLNNPATAVTIAARAANGIVVLDLTFQAGAPDEAARASPLSAEELRLLVETAGGAVIAASDSALSLEFRRASDPPPG
jgi:nitrogen fixation/metabolism regulation signal transduction histidine kinase